MSWVTDYRYMPGHPRGHRRPGRDITIGGLPNITEIWDKQVLSTKSFPHLANVDVSRCEKLVTVFPSIFWAQSLRDVSVKDCKGVTVVVSITGLEERDCSIIFPLLSHVVLSNLENLNAFCGNSTGLFDPQVIFPALEVLSIKGLPNITKIWDKQVIFPALEVLKIESLPNLTEIWDKQVLPTKSFPHLANVEVSGCEKLVTVFPSILWEQSLRDVSVKDCKGVTVVVSITGLEESGDSDNCSIIFPQLSFVCLDNLENLNAFCNNSSGSKPQSLFDPRVIFPALKDLYIYCLPNITEIWDKQVLPTKSFPHLANVAVSGCEKLVTVFPSILWAQSLRDVSVKDCKGVTVVVSITGLEESEDANNCFIIFPRLRKVKLMKLENLYAFCSNSSGSKPQSLFDPRAHFPALASITLENLPNIEIFKQQLQSREKVKFPALWDLKIVDKEDEDEEEDEEDEDEDE